MGEGTASKVWRMGERRNVRREGRSEPKIPTIKSYLISPHTKQCWQSVVPQLSTLNPACS